MMKRHIIVVAAFAVLTATSAAEAQEILLEGPLAGAPACRNCVLHREGRFSIAPMFTFTLLDDYRRHVIFGLRAQYNITDWIAISVHGGFAVPIDTGLTEEVAAKAPNGIETNRANFPFPADSDGAAAAERMTTDLLGRLMGYVAAELVFTPLRGKFGLFSRLFLDVDLYIFAGYSVPFVQERADVDCRTGNFIDDHPGGVTPGGWPADTANDDTCPWIGRGDVTEVPRADTRVAVGAGTYGFGVSVYANHFVAVNFEYRVMPFLWNSTGTDERGMALVDDVLTFCPSDNAGECDDTGEFPDHRVNENDRRWSANHMFAIGATFHFPIQPRRSE